MEIFEVHITGDESILLTGQNRGMKTITVDLLKPDRSYLRSEYMTSHVCRFSDYKSCKEYIDREVIALKEAGTTIFRVKIESPYYSHYVNESLYIESHFEAKDNHYPISINRKKTNYLATDRTFKKEEYSEFVKIHKDHELELCLYDSFPEEDRDWFQLY